MDLTESLNLLHFIIFRTRYFKPLDCNFYFKKEHLSKIFQLRPIHAYCKYQNIYLDVLGKLESTVTLVWWLLVKTHFFTSVFLLGADMMLAEVMGDENVK